MAVLQADSGLQPALGGNGVDSLHGNPLAFADRHGGTGVGRVPARVFPVEARRIKTVLQLGENAHRADLSLLEYLGGIEQLRDLGVPAGAMARMLCKPDEWVAAMMDISRDPLARSLYEAGIMTQVGAWEAFCRLPDHLRNGLLQSGEQLTIQRCRKVLDAHEAQMSARQQGLLESAGPQTSCPLPVLPGHDTSEEPEQDSASINVAALDCAPLADDVVQGLERSSGCGEHLVVPLWIPLDLANAILPARAREFRGIAEWVSGQREFSEEIWMQVESAEAALVAAISALVGVAS